MGDADVGASSLDSGEAGGLAASRALMEGGSLPPRKRLLAGLKQNGWLSTSPPPAEESPTAGGYASAPASVGGVARSGSGKYEDACMGCKAVESNGLRRIKRGGASLRLCSACTQLYSKSMFCPHCLAMYHDASLLGDPSMWLVCTRCRRSVHPECEQKHSGSKPDAASYVCLDCVNSVRRQREANGVTGMRSKHGSGRPVPNFHGETNSGASPVDFVSPSLKKPRLHRERSSRPGDHGDGSRFDRHRPSPDASGGARAPTLVPPRKVSSQATPLGAAAAAAASPQEAAAAAKNAAIAAAKVALAAKANAATKAGAAVKAAAAAKAALEAAALAAKAEAACRAELRRKTGNTDTRLGGAMRLEINVHSEPRRERSSKGEMKHEGEDGYGARRTGAGSVDDEELARQLHRVINSSPRISRSMTPMRRKNPSVKPETPSSGVSNSSAETVRARPRTTNPSPVEPEVKAPHEHDHHQFRHQQTRPRSITHKEFRRVDSRVSRHEVKTADKAALEPPSQQQQEAVLSHMEGDGQPAVKSEAMDGVMFAPVGVQDDASILFDALVEAEGEGLHAAAAGDESSHDRRPDYLQEILEAAVLTDAAMFNNGAHHVASDLETVRPETVTAEQGQERLDSLAGPKDADGESGDATKETPGEVTVAMTVDTVAAEVTDTMAVDVAETTAVEVAETPAVEVAETTAVEIAETTAVEVAETTTVEVPETTAVEVAEITDVEVAEPAAVEVAETPAVEVTGTMAVEVAETPAVEVVETHAVEVAETAAVEVADTTPVEVAETNVVEVAETTAVEVAETTADVEVAETTADVEVAETPAVEVAETTAVEVKTLEQDAETGPAVVQDAEMQEICSVDATPVDEAMPEPSSGATTEERVGGDAAVEETRIEADASPGSGPVEEPKPAASQSKAAGVTATASPSQQSG